MMKDELRRIEKKLDIIFEVLLCEKRNNVMTHIGIEACAALENKYGDLSHEN